MGIRFRPWGLVLGSWIIARGIIAIPKSSNEARIKENFEALEIELTNDDIEAINSLDKGERLINPEWSEFES